MIINCFIGDNINFRSAILVIEQHHFDKEPSTRDQKDSMDCV